MPKKFYTPVLILVFSVSFAIGQSENSKDSTNLKVKENNGVVTHFVEIGKGYYRTVKPIGYTVTVVDSNHTSLWKSPVLQLLADDNKSYLLKVDVPEIFSNRINEFWCSSAQLSPDGRDTVFRRVGGARPGNIRLNLLSNPKGIEVYLISKRWWDTIIEGKDWENNISYYEKWKVNTRNTDTYAMIDETVFVILFRLKNNLKKIIYKTLPASIERDQSVSVDFQQ